jgi:exportin-T
MSTVTQKPESYVSMNMGRRRQTSPELTLNSTLIPATVLKNASLHLATLLFLQVYPTASPQFFTSFLSLLRSYPASTVLPSSPPPLNPQTTDVLLRLLHEISLEISDAQLRLNKSPARLTRDAELRDAVREKDAPAIAAAVWEIVAEALDGVERPDDSGGKVGLKGKTAREVAEMAIRVAGDYVCACRLWFGMGRRGS